MQLDAGNVHAGGKLDEHRVQVPVLTNVEIACTVRSRLKGLYGRGGFDGALLLAPCNDVHTLAMRRPIDIAFLAPDGTVLESHRNVGANRRLKNRHASATLERFATNDPWFQAGDSIQHCLFPIKPT